MKILLSNVNIVDGTGSPAFLGNILVHDSLIETVSSDIIKGTFDQVIDCNGDYCTPGFIDVHSHSDVFNFIKDGLKSKISQGVTTEVTGMCGLGVAPISDELKYDFRNNLIIGNPDIDWNWQSFGEYIEALKKLGTESNISPFVGHGVLRYNIMGNSSSAMNDCQLAQLDNLLSKSFREGACGVSLGLIYLPAIYAKKNELRSIFKIAANNKKIVSVHMRSESDEIIEALLELIELAEETGAKLHIAHLKFIGQRNGFKYEEVKKIIEQHNIYFDHYPYVFGSTTLLSIIPPSFLDQELKTLTHHRSEINDIFSTSKINKGSPWDNIPNLVGWNNIEICEVQNETDKKYIGMSIQDIASIENKSETNLLIDLIIRNNGIVRMIDYFMSNELLKSIMQNDRGMFSTDTLYGSNPHPRVFGSYPTVIGDYVFKKKVISLEKAIYKMTSLPAKQFDIHNRGEIKAGKFADLLVFTKDFSVNKDKKYPVGIKLVMINGKIKIFEGFYQSEVRSGMVNAL